MTTARCASSMVLMPLLWLAFALLVVATMFVLLRACGLVLPGYGSWHRIGSAYCSARATPAQVDEDRTRALREVARQLELRVVQQQATCLAQLPPPPVAPPPPPPPQEAAKPEPPKPEPPKPEPPKPEPPKPEPPKQAAKPPPPPSPQLQLPPKPTNDLSFLKGCWRTDPFQHRSDGPKGVSTYCFDDKGKGKLDYTQVSNPNHVCSPSATASYEGEQLRIRDSDTKCSDGTTWYADNLDCRRGANDVAQCSGKATTTVGTDTWTVRLHRVR